MEDNDPALVTSGREQAISDEEAIPSSAPDRRTRQVIERSSARLASSSAQLKLSQARALHARGWVERNEAELERNMAAVEREANRHLRRMFSPVYLPALNPTELRRRFADSALKLAQTEDAIARHHEMMAIQLPHRADDCRSIAVQARAGARRAHQIADKFWRG